MFSFATALTALFAFAGSDEQSVTRPQPSKSSWTAPAELCGQRAWSLDLRYSVADLGDRSEDHWACLPQLFTVKIFGVVMLLCGVRQVDGVRGVFVEVWTDDLPDYPDPPGHEWKVAELPDFGSGRRFVGDVLLEDAGQAWESSAAGSRGLDNLGLDLLGTGPRVSHTLFLPHDFENGEVLALRLESGDCDLHVRFDSETAERSLLDTRIAFPSFDRGTVALRVPEVPASGRIALQRIAFEGGRTTLSIRRPGHFEFVEHHARWIDRDL